MEIFRKGDKIKTVSFLERDEKIKLGTEGEIIGIRPNDYSCALVKFKGKSYPVHCLTPQEIQKI